MTSTEEVRETKAVARTRECQKSCMIPEEKSERQARSREPEVAFWLFPIIPLSALYLRPIVANPSNLRRTGWG